MQFDFTCSTRVVFGVGRAAETGSLAAELGRRALLVSYRDLTGLESAVERVRASLQASGLQVIDFLEAVPDPSEQIAVAGRDLALAKEVDLVVGIGGGSALDAAKAIAYLATNPGPPWDYMACNPSKKPGQPSLPSVALPTTAGTGSEVSYGSVLTVEDRGLKGTIVDRAIAPRIAIVDAELMTGMPARLTAACGADALGHAIEGVLSRSATPISRGFGFEALGVIGANLRSACENGTDLEARSGMALGATLAGLSLANGGTIVTHAMSHATGSVLHLPPGVGVSVFTVPVLRYCAGACASDYARLAEAMGVDTSDLNEGAVAEAFIEAVSELFLDVGLSSEIDVPQELWSEDLAQRLAGNAFLSAPVSARNTPRSITQQQTAELIAQVVKPG